MSRARVVIPSLRAAEAVAAPALARGRCATRAEYRACSALKRVGLRGLGGYRDQQARKAFAALPKPGPGGLAYYRAVTYPNLLRRNARHERIHGKPGWGSPND